MKKFIQLLLIEIIFFIIYRIQWLFVVKLNYFESCALLLVTNLLFLITLIFVIYNIFKLKKCLKILSLISIILMVLFITYIPFTEAYIKTEFLCNFKARNDIVETFVDLKKNNEFDDVGKFKMIDVNKYELPINLKYLSLNGTFKVEYIENKINIQFPVYKFLDKNVDIIYSSDNQLKYLNTNYSVIKMFNLKDRWKVIIYN